MFPFVMFKDRFFAFFAEAIIIGSPAGLGQKGSVAYPWSYCAQQKCYLLRHVCCTAERYSVIVKQTKLVLRANSAYRWHTDPRPIRP
uniref:Putative secreted protein n=1 Tax=Ixodes ricinus TaxID=34613 RepID=A0A147BX81_IXORI